MFYIAEEDVSVINCYVHKALKALGNGAKRVDLDIDIGNGLNALTLTGYWVGDIVRIDIKVKK